MTLSSALLSSSTLLIEDPVSLFLSFVIVAAPSHGARRFSSFVRRSEGEVEAFAYSPLSSCCHPRHCLIGDPGSLFFAFVFYCHSERSEESRRHFTSRPLSGPSTRFHAAQVIDLAEVRRGEVFPVSGRSDYSLTWKILSDLLLDAAW